MFMLKNLQSSWHGKSMLQSTPLLCSEYIAVTDIASLENKIKTFTSQKYMRNEKAMSRAKAPGLLGLIRQPRV